MVEDDMMSLVSMASTTTVRDQKKRKAKQIIYGLKKEIETQKKLKQEYLLQTVSLRERVQRLENELETREQTNQKTSENKTITNQIENLKRENSKQAAMLAQKEAELAILRKQSSSGEETPTKNETKISNYNNTNINKTKQNIGSLQNMKQQVVDMKEQVETLSSDATLLLKRFIERETKQIITSVQNRLDELAQIQREEGEYEAQEFCGFFMKQGKKRKSWRKRWFIFRSDLTFEYFKNSQPGQKALNTVKCYPKFDVHVDPTLGKSFCFSIVTQNRIFHLVASNAEECHRTIERLRLWQEVNIRRMKSKSFN